MSGVGTLPTTAHRIQKPRYSAIRPNSAPWALDALLLALLPLIQIGISYWISVATLMAVLTVIRLRAQLATGMRAAPWVAALPLLMALPLIQEGGDDIGGDALRTGREVVVICLMIWLIRGTMRRPPRINAGRISQCLVVLTGLLLILTVIQQVALARGIYIGIPQSFYVTGSSTIPGELDLRYSALRPSATFSEPSYLAFAMLCILLVAAGRMDGRGKGGLLAGLATAAGLLSQSAGFVLSFLTVGGAFVARSIRSQSRLVMVILGIGIAAVALGITALVLETQLAFVDRLQAGATGTDTSMFARIFGPLEILPDYLLQYPIGLPIDQFAEAILTFPIASGKPWTEYGHNGLFNLFFQYGLLGFPIAALLLVRRDIVVSLFLLFCMIFNGAFLGVDKLSAICMAIAYYQAFRRPHDLNQLDGSVLHRVREAALQRSINTQSIGGSRAIDRSGDDTPAA